MAVVVRRCLKCGNIETRNHWNSMDEATKADALNPNWACPNCAWPEAELIEVETLDVAAKDKENVSVQSRSER
jgi:hypothetical protein